MSLAKTPCPAWCTTDHQRYRSHDCVVGTAGAVHIQVFQYADETASVVLRDEAARSAGAPYCVTIPAFEAPALAELMRRLKHPEIAGLIDRGIETIKADPDAPDWVKYIGTGARR